MGTMSTENTILAVKNALSAARMGTYEVATATDTTNPAAALALYAWNAQVSAALLVPLHICEVVVRNAISDALESLYGARWPWSTSFEQSLPAPREGYSPRRDVQNSRSHAITTGKTIPELKFVFWQKMFTSRYDERLWNVHLRRVLPNTNSAKSIDVIRQNLYEDLEHIRILRNRIAHHEPIFMRNLEDDLRRIVNVVELKSKITADWMMENQQASGLIPNRP